MSFFDNITVGYKTDIMSSDNKLKVAGSTKLLSFKQIDYRDDILFDTVTIGTGTAVYEQANGGVKMSVSANNDVVIRQSKLHAPYISGNPQSIEMTTINLAPITNVVKRFGYYTSNTVTPFNSNLDGCYLQTNDTTIFAKVSKDGTDLCNVAQANWNLDTMGAGILNPSGVTLDPTKFEILLMDFLYLGGTSCRFGTIIKGSIIWFHRYDHSNISNTTMFLSPNKPLRWEIRSTGGTSHLYHICGSVESQGTVEELGLVKEYSNNTTAVVGATVGTYYALLGVQKTFRNSKIRIEKFSGFAETTDKFLVQLRLNPTVAGTFTFNQEAGFPYAIATGVAANTVTGGTILHQVYGESGQGSASAIAANLLRMGTSIAGIGDNIVLCFTPIVNSTTMYGQIEVNSVI